MSTELDSQAYFREELCEQRTNLIREKQQAEEIVEDLEEMVEGLREGDDGSKSDENMKV